MITRTTLVITAVIAVICALRSHSFVLVATNSVSLDFVPNARTLLSARTKSVQLGGEISDIAKSAKSVTARSAAFRTRRTAKLLMIHTPKLFGSMR